MTRIGTFVVACMLAQAASIDTSMPGVTAAVASARQYGGVLHIGIRLNNAAAASAALSRAIKFTDIVLVDTAGGRKHYPLKDADHHFLGGPISDWNDDGAGSHVWIRRAK